MPFLYPSYVQDAKDPSKLELFAMLYYDASADLAKVSDISADALAGLHSFEETTDGLRSFTDPGTHLSVYELQEPIEGLKCEGTPMKVGTLHYAWKKQHRFFTRELLSLQAKICIPQAPLGLYNVENLFVVCRHKYQCRDVIPPGMQRPQQQLMAELQDLLLKSSSPTFFIKVWRSQIAICAGMFPSHIVIQELAEYLPFPCPSDSEATLLRFARNLSIIYASISTRTASQEQMRLRLYPTKTDYLRADGTRASFDTLGPEEGPCTTFLAREHPCGHFIVVKVLRRAYGGVAHRLLADHKLAPALTYNGPLWEWGNEPESAEYTSPRMVIMEYVKGPTVHDLDLTNSAVRDAVRERVRNALSLLHGHQPPLVHGDIRPPNIVVAEPSGVASITEGVRIIDFDWAGEEGVVCYPDELNMDQIAWAAGVSPSTKILGKHDLDMLTVMLPSR
ncbi:uncharacterized protein BXZ73DRAFT_78576 [Epithele typhae]|uniref:uncharacterized protein n=1 Tax=Epithele typhae TaxID=378194 RepID=UPI002008717B|nr:uncharacterized protein BXZ73DRAFT_78576 [Epithele typhae]KAH9927092.1 hypothetical protein BXZ73DRAFT_78576 [Epithele typhae]